MAEALTFNIGADTKGFQDGISGLLGKLAGLVAAFVRRKRSSKAQAESDQGILRMPGSDVPWVGGTILQSTELFF
jgi:hypothetical protein